MKIKKKEQIFFGVEHYDILETFRSENNIPDVSMSELVQLLVIDYKNKIDKLQRKDKSNFYLSKDISLILTMVSSLMKDQEVPLEDRNDVLQYHQALKNFEKELGRKDYQKKKIPKNIQEQLKEKTIQESFEVPVEKKIMAIEEDVEQTPEQMREELVRKGYISE